MSAANVRGKPSKSGGIVPEVDFTGVIQVRSLEIGVIEMHAQPIPAVRFLLDQTQSYSILSSAHQAGEVYAYCVAALERGITELDVKMACVLLVDINGILHVVTSRITWYTSAGMREQAAAGLLHVFENEARSEFKTCSSPFMVVKSGK